MLDDFVHWISLKKWNSREIRSTCASLKFYNLCSRSDASGTRSSSSIMSVAAFSWISSRNPWFKSFRIMCFPAFHRHLRLVWFKSFSGLTLVIRPLFPHFKNFSIMYAPKFCSFILREERTVQRSKFCTPKYILFQVARGRLHASLYVLEGILRHLYTILLV